MIGRTKNLLLNPCAKEHMDYWKVVHSQGNGFSCEKPPHGCKDFSKFCKMEDEVSCWATSFAPCVKLQLVYLPEGGVSTEKLDNKKPPITVQDWYTSRADCGCEYTLRVKLLADGMNTILGKWDFNDTLVAGADWKKVRYVFKDYPKGVRYVVFQHGGKDTQYWRGHYGVKMTNSAVFVGKKVKGQKKRFQDLKDANGKNLLNNASAQSGLDEWDVLSSGGDGWAVEKEAFGTDPVLEAVPFAEESSCWSTSYGDCVKKQVVDLGVKGFDADIMDDVKPKIIVSEWLSPRQDAGCHYWLKVSLLNQNMQEVDSKEIKECRGAGARWSQVGHTFSDYGDGVRFISYSHGGRDNCYWAGHYGAKITHSSVMIDMEFGDSCPSSSSDEEN